MVRELHGCVEDPRVLDADREQARVDGEIPDVPTRHVADRVVQRHDARQVKLPREEVREEHVLRVLGLHVLGPGPVADRIGEDEGDVIGRMEDHALEHVDGEAGPREGRGDRGAEVRAMQFHVAFQEPDHQEGDRLRLVLGRDELSRERVSVLEVVRDGRMDPTVDGLEPVVPPGEEGGS